MLGIVTILAWYLYPSRFLARKLPQWAAEQGYQLSLGKVEYSLFSPTEVRLHNLVLEHIAGHQNISLPQVFARIAVTDLFSRKLNVRQLDIEVDKLEISDLTTSQDTTTQDKSLPFLRHLVIAKGKVSLNSVLLALPEHAFSAQNLTLELSRLRSKVAISPLETLSGKFQLQLEAASYQSHQLKQLSIMAQLKDQWLDVNEFSAELFNGYIDTQWRARLFQQPELEVQHLTLANLQLILDDAILKQLSVDFSAPQTSVFERIQIEELKLDNTHIEISSDAPFILKQAKLHISKLPLVEDNLWIWDNKAQPKQGKLSLYIHELSGPDLELQNSHLEAKLSKGVINVEQARALLWKKPLNLSARIPFVDLTQAVQITSYQSQLDIKKLMHVFEASAYNWQGTLELNGNAQFVMTAPMETLQSELSLDSRSLALQGLNLDALFQGFVDSQETSLTDAGTFLLGGPLTLFTSRLTSLTRGARSGLKGRSQIEHFNAKIRMQGPEVEIREAAIAMQKHRAAFEGKLNLETQKFNNLTLAVLDHQGCARVSENFNGSFHAPVGAISRSLVGALVNPFLDVAMATSQIITGNNKCKPFYRGPVAHPVKNKAKT